MKFIHQGEWVTSKGLAQCVEQEGFGIIGAVIDCTGEGYLMDLLLAAPDLLAACKAIQFCGVKGKMPDGRWARDLIDEAVAKAEGRP